MMEKESYFALTSNEQLEILQYYSNQLLIRDAILEKDIWLCLVLDIIFNIPNRHPMAFKGGTSLSKVFDVIHRFSEDIDITLDYRSFDVAGIFNPSISKTKAKLLSEQLKVSVKEYRDSVIVPTIKARLESYSYDCQLRVDESGEKIWVDYPSVLSPNTNQYMKESVLIELGGRNIIDPNEVHIVKPYISTDSLQLKFPEPLVTVLSPQRTFWEKATLIHVECHRGIRQSAERLSRHWYDLVKLYEEGIGKDAIENIDLLVDVVRHKSIFFNASYAHYEDCLNNQFKLIPQDLTALRRDYSEMSNAGMVYDSDKFSFEYIIQKVKEISDRINCI